MHTHIHTCTYTHIWIHTCIPDFRAPGQELNIGAKLVEGETPAAVGVQVHVNGVDAAQQVLLIVKRHQALYVYSVCVRVCACVVYLHVMYVHHTEARHQALYVCSASVCVYVCVCHIRSSSSSNDIWPCTCTEHVCVYVCMCHMSPDHVCTSHRGTIKQVHTEVIGSRIPHIFFLRFCSAAAWSAASFARVTCPGI